MERSLRYERIFFAAVVALAPLYACLAASHARAIEPLSDRERSTIALFERASPSVVGITTLIDVNDPSKFRMDTGSGFIWDGSGNIVTNEHVVHGADTIEIALASGERLVATIVGVAPNYDLAVVRVKDQSHLPAPIAIGRSAELKVGQSAYAIGSPFGLDQSLTTGVISGLGRRLPTGRYREVANMVQTDAAVYPGSSGGPLLDSAGRLIGVNTTSYRLDQPHTALGFAIPVDVVSRIVPQLIHNGRVATAGIGIVPDDEAIAMRSRTEGVIVARVRRGFPAERAGVRGAISETGKPGDVIVAANGTPIRSAFELTNLLERIGIGRSVELTVSRDGHAELVAVDIIDVGEQRQ
jgi:2-alkenal reductase